MKINKDSNLYRIIICGLLSLFLLVPFADILGQDSLRQQEIVKKRYSLFAVPLIFFTPETRWGFGTAGIYTFRLKGERMESRPSKLQLGFLYTMNKQVLFYLPYQLFIGDESINIYGEVGYYLFSYKYFGIGNDTKKEAEETYDVDYPRFRINALKKVRPNLYLGLRYWMDDYNLVGLDSEGVLNNGNIPGSNSSFLSGAGLVLNYDSRDNLFFPSSGHYIETVLFANGKYLGSDFDFNKFYLDVRTYRAVKKSVFAFNFLTELTSGTAPFNQLAYIGGANKMRGIFEGRFKDNHLMVFQGEYRCPLFWRLKAALFASYGMVAADFGDFRPNHFKLSYGVGLRVLVNKKEKIHLRFDAGFGKKTNGFYVTIGEAF